MAKISARGATELLRWFDVREGRSYLLRSDGTILWRLPSGSWSTWGKVKNNTPEGRTAFVQAKRELADKPVANLVCHCAEKHGAALAEWVKAGKVGESPCSTMTREVHAPARYLISRIEPNIHRLMDEERDGKGSCPDGCEVEPDGTCQHGWPTWMRLTRII